MFEMKRVLSDCIIGIGDVDDGKWGRVDNLIDENCKGLVWKKLVLNMWNVLFWVRSYLMWRKLMGNIVGYYFLMLM